MNEMTGGEAVVEALKACGVEHIFGIPSVHNIAIYDAILRTGGITPISVRHEQGAVHAADGYARASGKLGVAIASTGPGTSNTMTGLYEAGIASSRVLLITGQGETAFYGKGKGYGHEAENQLPMLRTVTRRAESIRRTEDIAETIVRVAEDINTGRPQPGAIEIPVDLQYNRARVDIPHIEAWPRVQPAETALTEAAQALSKAKKPLIWAGGGVISAGASGEITQLAELLNAPVVTTTNGRGSIPETHPLAASALTVLPQISEVIADADVVLAVGTRFQPAATAVWTTKITGTLIHVDADPRMIDLNYKADIGVVGDARLALAGILRQVKSDGAEASFVEGAKASSDAARNQVYEEIGPGHHAVMNSMRELMPDDAVFVRDATLPAYLWANRVFPILRPQTSIHPTSGAIGPGMPFAIGAAVGSSKQTVLIQGDGGFMLSIGELATAVQHNLQIVVCVFNNDGYGILRTLQSRNFEDRQIGVDLATPDFAKVAEGMGMASESVTGVDGFKEAFARGIAHDGPYLLDIDMNSLGDMGGFGAQAKRRT